MSIILPRNPRHGFKTVNAWVIDVLRAHSREWAIPESKKPLPGNLQGVNSLLLLILQHTNVSALWIGSRTSFFPSMDSWVLKCVQCCHSKATSDSDSGALQSVTHCNAGSALWHWMTLHLNPTQPIYLLTTRTVAVSSWTGHNHYNPSHQLWFYCQSIPLDSERH